MAEMRQFSAVLGQLVAKAPLFPDALQQLATQVRQFLTLLDHSAAEVLPLFPPLTKALKGLTKAEDTATSVCLELVCV